MEKLYKDLLKTGTVLFNKLNNIYKHGINKENKLKSGKYKEKKLLK